MRRTRVLCYVQHLMGIGHQRRMAAISRALGTLGVDVTYVSGGFAVPGLDRGAVRFVQLPPARSADLSYKQLVDDGGRPVTETWRCARRDMLLNTFERARPDALVIETFPFGRRMLRFELLPLLEAARRRPVPPAILCSVRDIVEHRDSAERNAEILDYLHRYFDAILVHGDPKLVRFEQSFPPARTLSERIRYTGYVMHTTTRVPAGAAGTGEVIVSAGGGAYGGHVLRAALAARSLSVLAAVTWRVLAGSNLSPEGFEQLCAATPDGVVVERNRADFTTLLHNCRVSISQGGYNTVLEVLQAGTRAVLVPYRDAREQEQALRAGLLARRGLVHVVDNDELTPQALAAAVDAADRAPAPPRTVIDTDGAHRAARLIAEHAGAAARPA